MEVSFAKPELDKLETDANYTGGFPAEIVRMYRRRMQSIRAATDERDLYAIKSLRYKKLKGDREHQKSMRLNDQWRLIVESEKQSSGKTEIQIVAIEDYH